MKKRRKIVLGLVVGLWLVFFGLAAPVSQVSAAPGAEATTPPPPTATTPPPPPITPTPSPTPTPEPSIIYHIHKMLFSGETISDAINQVFGKAVDEQQQSIGQDTATWAIAIGEVVQGTSEGYYQAAAKTSFPVAAAIAVPLFLLRLALYHWGRLTGEDDQALRVIGDWVTAGVLAVAAGYLLDLVVEVGWWGSGKVLGETVELATAFLKATSLAGMINGAIQYSFLMSLISLGLSLGGIFALAGMLFAFASAQGILYVLAILAAPVAILSVLPQVRWLRSLWLKVIIVIALLPLVAGGIFKAAVMASNLSAGGGLLSSLVRVLWLWGAAGLMLSMAGILGRFTITATADAAKQTIAAVGKIAGAVAAGVATGGASAVVSAGTGAAAGTAATSTTAVTATTTAASGAVPVSGAPAAGSPALAGSQTLDALGHLRAGENAARQATALERSSILGNLFGLGSGLRSAAAVFRLQSQEHALAARRAEMEERINRFEGLGPRSASDGSLDDSVMDNNSISEE